MKFNVTDKWRDKVSFTADIEALDSTPESIKLGMAAVWGYKNGSNLRGSDLYGVNLRGADLYGADLYRSNLIGADLYEANISGANLYGADLYEANISGANLYGADLREADLNGAKLNRANLSGAKLDGANLSGADLSGADLSEVSGINDWIKCIQIEEYPIAYTARTIQIGCERHTLNEWRSFDDERIIRMDGKKALQFWRKYKDWIFQTIELCPALPTKGE